VVGARVRKGGDQEAGGGLSGFLKKKKK